MTRNQKVLAAVLAVGLLITSFGLANAQSGIPSYYWGHYKHATQVLQQENPAFLTAFKAFEDEIKTVDSSNKQAQYDALMRFFPAIEEMAYMDSYVANKRDANGVLWDLQLEVIVSFFSIDLSTADENSLSTTRLLIDAFMQEVGGGDGVIILSENELIKKHNISREQAQRIRQTLHKLYRYSLEA